MIAHVLSTVASSFSRVLLATMRGETILADPESVRQYRRHRGFDLPPVQQNVPSGRASFDTYHSYLVRSA